MDSVDSATSGAADADVEWRKKTAEAIKRYWALSESDRHFTRGIVELPYLSTGEVDGITWAMINKYRQLSADRQKRIAVFVDATFAAQEILSRPAT